MHLLGTIKALISPIEIPLILGVLERHVSDNEVIIHLILFIILLVQHHVLLLFHKVFLMGFLLAVSHFQLIVIRNFCLHIGLLMYVLNPRHLLFWHGLWNRSCRLMHRWLRLFHHLRPLTHCAMPHSIRLVLWDHVQLIIIVGEFLVYQLELMLVLARLKVLVQKHIDVAVVLADFHLF